MTHEGIVQHHVGSTQQLSTSPRDQFRVPRTRAYQICCSHRGPLPEDADTKKP